MAICRVGSSELLLSTMLTGGSISGPRDGLMKCGTFVNDGAEDDAREREVASCHLDGCDRSSDRLSEMYL